MESGRMTTQRWPSFRSLAVFTAAAMAVPELPPWRATSKNHSVQIKHYHTTSGLLPSQCLCVLTAQQALLSDQHARHVKGFFIVRFVPRIHHLTQVMWQWEETSYTKQKDKTCNSPICQALWGWSRTRCPPPRTGSCRSCWAPQAQPGWSLQGQHQQSAHTHAIYGVTLTSTHNLI